MASILQVEQIQGPTSGANANTITIPSGQTLDASNATLTGLLAPDGDGSNLTGVGKVLQTHYWRVPATSVSTSGGWAYNTTPTRGNTYSVSSTTFTRISSTSKVYGIATGHVDSDGASGAPTIVSLLAVNDTLFGAAYRHLRNSGQEPFHYGFAFEDNCTQHTDNANPVYYLTCHSSANSLHFSRMYAGTTPNNPYTILFWEVEA